MCPPLIVKNITKQKAPHIRNGFPDLRGFHFVNRGRGPKYTVPCPKGRPRRTRRQGEDAERRRAQKDISGPAVHADGGTGGRLSPLLSDGGMVGQRRPGDVYKMRLQIGVHNGAFCCSGTLMKRRKFNGGKRCRLAFHAVDRGSNPLGDAKDFTALQKRFIIGVCCLQTHVYKMPRGIPACGAFPFPADVRLRSLYCSRPERPS